MCDTFLKIHFFFSKIEQFNCVSLVKKCEIFHNSEKIKNTHLTFTCSKSTIETLEKGVKYVQSQQ